MTSSRFDRQALAREIESRRAEFVSVLSSLVNSPSVSMQPAHRADCRRTAEIAAKLVEERGGTARLVETDGNPVVVGELAGPEGAPVVTIYNHLDVQPAARGEDGWTRDPFVFAEENGRFYGRGATDDKGPAATALLGASLAREHGVPLTVRFLWELEEEIGSAHFESFLQREKERLATECVVVSDTMWIAPGKPAIPYGLRGLATALLILETADKDAHSGVTGGVARNPVAEICEVIAGCLDARTGAVKIEGFDRTWSPPSTEELQGFLDSGFDVETFRRSQALRSMRATDAAEVTSRIWARPTMEVHGIRGGYQGDGVKTIVPPRAEAKVSFRLVPPQEPEPVIELLRAHVRKLNPDVQVIGDHGIRAYLGQREGPLGQAASDAFEFAFGARPAFIREGGSIGAVLLMDQYLKAPITFLGMSLPEHGYHGPDEYFDWGQAAGGMATFAHFLDRVASWKH
ncbi:MAG TPA: M20/M25/M40 family metallo-hydrolase [Candidatus Eisenbacteria bacterium]|jgi:acetylornithine deacetylase/succinyl-diaminopimelate desuccinylase-like protein|nr:M20/M25/M40 family metallo-hydrolase [Candidatus Eisenbacteria bacterium]